MSKKGKEIYGKKKGSNQKEFKGKILDEVFNMVDENRYVIQQLDLGGGKKGFRIGYYTCDVNFKRLYYGGYSPIMKDTDFKKLLDEAKKKGWFK
jgi:hypothetical protein